MLRYHLWVVEVGAVDMVGSLFGNLGRFYLPEIIQFAACRLAHLMIDGVGILLIDEISLLITLLVWGIK